VRRGGPKGSGRSGKKEGRKDGTSLRDLALSAKGKGGDWDKAGRKRKKKKKGQIREQIRSLKSS